MSAPAGQLAILEAGPACLPALSQWLTDPKLARSLIGLAEDLFLDANKRRIPIRVLEPSAGRGNLVRAVLDRCPIARVDAVDVDPRWHMDLARISPAVTAYTGDYLARPALPCRERYALGVTNPPYDDGAEAAHLAKLLDECERILAVLPVRSMHGRDRYVRIWRRFDPSNAQRDWWIRQKVHCISRPKFGPDGGMDEILLLDLRRAPGDCVERWL